MINRYKISSFDFPNFTAPILPVIVTAYNLKICMLAEDGIQFSLFENVVVSFINH
jgi:hypothetical protein